MGITLNDLSSWFSVLQEKILLLRRERKKKNHLILSEIIVNKMCFLIVLTLQKGSLLHIRDAGDYSALGF